MFYIMNSGWQDVDGFETLHETLEYIYDRYVDHMNVSAEWGEDPLSIEAYTDNVTIAEDMF